MHKGLQTRHPERSRRGSVLVYGIVAVMTIGFLAAATFEMVSSVTRRQASALDQKLSLYMAEAGLAEARTGVLMGKTGNVGSEGSPALLGEGIFWVEAEDLGDSQVRLTSIGMVGSGSAKLSLVLERGDFDIASLGVFSQNIILFEAGTTIDWHDSVTGESSAGGDQPTTGARIGSNGNIIVRASEAAPTVINGTLTSGPQSIVEISPFATHIGKTEQRSAAQVLAPVEVPTVRATAAVVHRSQIPLIIPRGQWGATHLEIAEGSEVVLTGPMTLVLNQLHLAQQASLRFDTRDGEVRVVVQDALSIAAGARLTTSSEVVRDSTLEVAGQTDQPVTLLGEGPFHGIIYAPEAEVIVADSFEVFGALVGGTLIFQGGSTVHFDQGLLGVPADTAFPSLVSWRLVELASEGAVGSDPFRNFDLDRALLSSPAESHADTNISISYLDRGGRDATYDGLESNFNWSDVDTIKEIERDGFSVPPLGRTDSESRLVDEDVRSAFQDALDLIANLGYDSSRVREYLLFKYPSLPGYVLIAAIERAVPLKSKDLAKILLGTSSLSNRVLLKAINNSPLSDSHLRKVLEANSPLGADVLLALQNRVPAMSASDLSKVITAQ